MDLVRKYGLVSSLITSKRGVLRIIERRRKPNVDIEGKRKSTYVGVVFVLCGRMKKKAVMFYAFLRDTCQSVLHLS